MNVSILELLPDRPRTLGNTIHSLNPDTLEELVDPIVRILFVSVRSENLDPIRDGRVRLFPLGHGQEGLGRAHVGPVFRHCCVMIWVS